MRQLIQLEYHVMDNGYVDADDHNKLCDIVRSVIGYGIAPNEPILEMSPQTEFGKLYTCCMDVLSRALQPILN
jgi:hypothetical protein